MRSRSRLLTSADAGMRGITSATGRRNLRCVLTGAATLCLAVVGTFQRAGVIAGAVSRTVQHESGGVSVLLAHLVEAELGLDGDTVNTVAVEALPGPFDQLHVLLAAVCIDGEGHLEMQACHHLGIRQLPDVNVVAADDARQLLDILADVLDANVFGGCLEEDSGSSEGERDRGLEDDGRDQERHGGIGVVLARQVGEPDDESSDDDTNIAQRIAEDVEDHGIHAHVGVVVATGLRAKLARQRVVMAVMNTRVSARPTLLGS